ncbi:MAG: penicillin-binding protein [Bradymonadales bacterium]|nr:penicillin-binding protein [Bradymonadales bacterium]
MNEPIGSTRKPLFKRRGVRISLIVLLLLVALVIGLVQAFPHLLERFVRSRLQDMAVRMHRQITFGDLEMETLNRIHFTDLAISDGEPYQDRPFFSASRLTIGLDRSQLFARKLVLTELVAVEPQLSLRDREDGSSNYRAALEPLLARLGLGEDSDHPPDSGDGEDAGTEGPSEHDGAIGWLEDLVAAGMPRVSVTGGGIDLSGASLEGAPAYVDDLEIRIDPTGSGHACDFQLDARVVELEIEALTEPVRQVSLRGHLAPEDDVAVVELGLGEPVELRQIPGFPEITLRVGSVGFNYPYTFTIEELEVVDRRTRYTVVRVPRLEVSLAELTFDPRRIYLSLVKAQGIRVSVDIDRQGRTNVARLLGVPGAGPLGYLLPPDRRVQEEDQPIPPIQPPVEGVELAARTEPEPRSALEQELARRRWWEIMPQMTDLSDITFEILVHDEGRPIRTLDLEIPQVVAAKRLYHFQMDFSAEARLVERGVGGVGSIAAEVVYYYLPENWSLELTFNQVDLQRFIDVMPFPNLLGIVGGQLNGMLMLVDNRPEENLQMDGDLSLTDFGLLAPTLDSAAIDDLNISYDFALSYDEQRQFSMQRGHLTVGETHAEVLLQVAGLELAAATDYLIGFTDEHDAAYWQRRSGLPAPWERVQLQVDMARQPVMTVFHSVPGAFRRRLEGTEMTGEVGWRLDAEAIYQRLPDGHLEVSVPEPLVADVLDEGVALLNLPAEVDVRRLMTDFSFTFVDGIGQMRSIIIGKNNPHWATLDQISPIMVQSILNTEDQSFFTNDGFNWTQMRSVIAHFLAGQEFGRGASTISMQTAKNIFLSRERQLSRKFAEMFLTYWMSRLIPKGRILELYLNVIEFGPGINGVSEASTYYFGERPSDLSLGESTFLVSIVPNPRLYHYFYEQGAISDRWWQHMQRYMRRLLQRGVITQEEYDRAIRRRPQFYIRGEGSPTLRPEPLPEDLILPFLELDR